MAPPRFRSARRYSPAASGSLPTAPDQLLWLARSLERTPTELREEYRRVTRRARRVVDRVFYGRGG